MATKKPKPNPFNTKATGVYLGPDNNMRGATRSKPISRGATTKKRTNAGTKRSTSQRGH